MNTWGDLDRLLRHLDARLDSQPDYADVRNLRGLVRAHRGDLAGAREDLEAAVRVNADYTIAQFNLAWAHLQAGDPGAVDRAAAIAARLPEPWRTHIEIARIATTAGPTTALDALDREPRDTDAWWDLDRLWLLVESQNWDAVDGQLKKLAARDADLPSILHAAGLQRRDAPDRDTLAAWSACYRGNPYGAAVCATGAELAHAAGALEESRRLLAWGLALSLDLCAYWVALGTQHESLAEERAALVALRRAVEVDPNRVAARVALGWLFAARGLPREAIVELEIAARLAPGYADVRYQLGLLYSEIGRADLAETELRAALTVQPDYSLARLALGCLLESIGRNAEALELLQDVRRAGIRSADLDMHLATLHARLGHRNQARRAQARARASGRGAVTLADTTKVERE